MTTTHRKRAAQRKGPEGLRALDRSATILYALAAHPAGLTLTDLVRETGLTAPTVHRMLAALRAKALTRETPSGLHALGVGTLILSGSYLEGLDLRTEALPHLRTLNHELNETCHLGSLSSPHIVYIEKLDSTHPVRMVSRVGATMPAVKTAMGKAILAHSHPDVVDRVLHDTRTQLGELVDEAVFRRSLAETVERGYGTDLEENEPGICCVGAVVRGNTGAPVAAISISAPATRFHAARVDQLGHRVREVAGAISESLGYLSPQRVAELRSSMVHPEGDGLPDAHVEDGMRPAEETP